MSSNLSNERLDQIARNTRLMVSCDCYNKLAHTLLTFGGTDTKTFEKDTIHAFSWLVVSGTVDVTIDGVTIEYSTGNAVQFTTVNGTEVTIQSTAGSAIIQWIY